METIEAWMSGYHGWQTQTHPRSTHAPVVLPATGPGYFDKVLGA
ncbi:hypothetical protein [Streptomyces alboniger]|nr:hypothetical protein [Streptomyces alboniger]